ncbi:hypothetical protein SBBP2_190032 [Burkholderiales bacterium]|nr:hypothetical protein SBBP2_190032 [Burkholderiales bacterium]
MRGLDQSTKFWRGTISVLTAGEAESHYSLLGAELVTLCQRCEVPITRPRLLVRERGRTKCNDRHCFRPRSERAARLRIAVALRRCWTRCGLSQCSSATTSLQRT